MSKPSLLLIRRESSAVTSLCIDRPRALNALTPEIIEGISAEYAKLIQKPSLQPHVVILKGAGDKVSPCRTGGSRSISVTRGVVCNSPADAIVSRMHATHAHFCRVQAFCAGGDVKSVVREAVSGNWRAGVEFFRAEFQLDYLISRLAASSPSIIQIALMDGIVMGGGAGLCMHGPFRVATERCAGHLMNTAHSEAYCIDVHIVDVSSSATICS